MNRQDKKHEVDWTPNKVARFWDFMAGTPATDNLYFSEMVGASIVQHVRRAGVPRNGRVLDFGCGPGHLLEKLLKAGYSCEGVDFSRRSVTKANQRLSKDWKGFKGARTIAAIPTDLESDAYDVLFLIETLEHLIPEQLSATLSELNRLAATGGYLVVTTPNEEHLAAGKVMCPDCGAVFHRMQHIHSWSPHRLDALMKDHGFDPVLCRSVYFTQPTWQSRAKATLCRVLGQKLPHLLYIGRKVRLSSHVVPEP